MAEPPPRGLDFTPPFIAGLGVTTAAILLVLYHCITHGWCGRNRSRMQQTQALRPEQDQTSSSFERSIVQLLPPQRYSKDSRPSGVDEEDAMCAVCLGEFKEGEEVRILPECTHAFHVECIDMWLFSHSNCPLCRASTTPVCRTDSVTNTSTPVQAQTDVAVTRMPEAPRLPLTDFGGQFVL